MKIAFIIFLTFFYMGYAHTQNADFEWAIANGGSFIDVSMDNHTDLNGNVYTSGYFYTTVDFDPDIAVLNLTSNGDEDIFIQKLDANGSLLWARSFGGTGDDRGANIVTDQLGSVYISGTFNNTMDADPGPNVFNLISNGYSDFFILKLDLNGDFVWAKSFGGLSAEYYINMDVDAGGNLYLSGSYRDSLDFDPSNAVYQLQANGNTDVFVQKLDTFGNFVWAKSIGGAEADLNNGISTDNYGNAYLTGSYRNTVDFNPGNGVFNLTSSGIDDVYLLKLNHTGDFEWANSFGNVNNESGRAIHVNDSGFIFLAGTFQNTIDLDPSGGISNVVSNGGNDVFVVKIDTSGAFEWGKSFGGTMYESCSQIISNPAGELYIVGSFLGTINFNQTNSISNFTSNGYNDIYILKLGSLGDFQWAKTIGGPHQDAMSSVSLDLSQDLYFSGNYQNTVDLNPDTGILNFTVNGYTDFFVLKLDQCIVNYTTDTIIACENYTWMDGVTYNTSNDTATHILTNVEGCDSVVTLNLTILYGNSSMDTIVACDNYTWMDGITYSSNNTTATHVLTNISGCDSVVTLNLTVLNSSAATEVISACGPYMWIDGITYAASNNTATYTLPNAVGCDSVISLDLTIDNVNTMTSLSGITITALGTGTYQWLDCNKGYAVIVGANAQTYTPIENGDYAVELSNSNCVDTSACIQITGLGVNDNFSINDIHIFPNPTNGKINVTLSEHHLVSRVFLINIAGEVIQNLWIDSEHLNIDLEALTPGLYFLSFETLNAGRLTYKIVKE
ncbi:hypothetical protein DNU06_00990 [Putridiphycobacter roseus]|uniref:Secretion system C-terminal sorting domain-containing protein n=1 Tax=Putridiphycobacter roseus TaxID=2219161 RepID=A0A2W1N5M1_9FLAO|nr:T9SS type A sorting domain-containing protein [Putridiphycobacter roseus]PZE18441.1 hypothetical protein DNU06_00990 [Putridiphycobacter roseus]